MVRAVSVLSTAPWQTLLWISSGVGEFLRPDGVIPCRFGVAPRFFFPTVFTCERLQGWIEIRSGLEVWPVVSLVAAHLVSPPRRMWLRPRLSTAPFNPHLLKLGPLVAQGPHSSELDVFNLLFRPLNRLFSFPS